MHLQLDHQLKHIKEGLGLKAGVVKIQLSESSSRNRKQYVKILVLYSNTCMLRSAVSNFTNTLCGCDLKTHQVDALHFPLCLSPMCHSTWYLPRAMSQAWPCSVQLWSSPVSAMSFNQNGSLLVNLQCSRLQFSPGESNIPKIIMHVTSLSNSFG